jgi:restriction system protein
MGRRSFVSAINAIAREQAREQRRIEREQVAALRLAERQRKQLAINLIRSQKQREKEDKQQYLASRIEEAADITDDIETRVRDLSSLLSHTLSIDDTITFESLRIREPYSPTPLPQELLISKKAPDRQDFLLTVKPLGLLERALGLKGRYRREVESAEKVYHAALADYNAVENERQQRLLDLKNAQDISRRSFESKVAQRDAEVDALEQAYREGETAAILTYNTMVLERSRYPDGFPQEFRLAYVPESKEIVIDYEFPSIGVVPEVVEAKYSKSKDVIEEKPRKAADIKALYQDTLASITLRTIHEVLEADQGKHIDVIVFSGFVCTVDPATGKDIRPCLISVRTTRVSFESINLGRVEKRACLRNLGAQVSPQPQALQAVKPVVEFDMVDKRFVEHGDILSDVESRPNLMDLTPTEFEVCVSNLFARMGLETKLTRASRDGGVDAVAFDTRPVLGGKVVIQAKRYRHTVGVSAVRDLYGTMLNEGASKGILVATSTYGPDAYEFAKDKPMELIDGGGLLYLLEQVGVKARIVFPDDVAGI